MDENCFERVVNALDWTKLDKAKPVQLAGKEEKDKVTLNATEKEKIKSHLEELQKWGKQRGWCPYYLTRQGEWNGSFLF